MSDERKIAVAVLLGTVVGALMPPMFGATQPVAGDGAAARVAAQNAAGPVSADAAAQPANLASLRPF